MDNYIKLYETEYSIYDNLEYTLGESIAYRGWPLKEDFNIDGWITNAVLERILEMHAYNDDVAWIHLGVIKFPFFSSNDYTPEYHYKHFLVLRLINDGDTRIITNSEDVMRVITDLDYHPVELLIKD